MLLFQSLYKTLLASFRDLIPIVVVILIFQFFVVKQPLPSLADLMIGLMMVVIGLTLFIKGLDLGLFPIGNSMAHALAKKGSLFWLIVFAFSLGFGTTIAEPALIAVASEAADVAARAGEIGSTEAIKQEYAFGLRLTVAFAVGFAIVVGVIRIIKGWPIHVFIMIGYAGVITLTAFAPREIVSLAYDSGGVTTSTVTVPLVAALGVGLASSIKGRNPMVDGFGLIAFASLSPIIFVLLYGMFIV
ncbi:MAG: hypothetical protein COB04_18525 [Gammaproteobacteria bacterium]|nr:MAG: hypothetical protein COB04_18525 [Gammaproteobacteria bacterium]